MWLLVKFRVLCPSDTWSGKDCVEIGEDDEEEEEEVVVDLFILPSSSEKRICRRIDVSSNSWEEEWTVDEDDDGRV